MTPEHYRQLYKKIDGAIQTKRNAELARIEAELLAERDHLIESINATWMLDNETPPPTVEFQQSDDIDRKPNVVKARPESARRSNGDHFLDEPQDHMTRNDKVRTIVHGLDKETIVTTQLIMEKIGEQYPEIIEGLIGRTTIISKLLREMANKNQLEKLRDAVGVNPTVYRKL